MKNKPTGKQPKKNAPHKPVVRKAGGAPATTPNLKAGKSSTFLENYTHLLIGLN